MPYKEPQLITVRRQLKEAGQVSRNWALQRRITRLAAIIPILRRQGWGIEDGVKRDGDFIYKLKYKPE